MKKLWSYLLGVSLAIPAVLAQPTVKSGLVGFANGVKALLKGYTDQFVDGLILATPVIGLFIVVFGLMFFLTKSTLFKDDAHSKYARMIAIGIALVGIAQQTVFNAILAWSTNLLIFSFIAAVIFMFIIFFNKSRTQHYSASHDMFDAKTKYLGSKSEELKAKKGFNKIKHELSMDDKLYARTEKDLASLDYDLRDTSKLYGDELRQVDVLADLLRKATAAADRGDNNQVHGYVQALSRDLGSLTTTMQHESKNTSRFGNLLMDVRKNLSYAFNDDKKELSEENHIQLILKRHLKNIHGIKGIDIEKHSKELLKEGSDVHKHLLAIRHASNELKRVEDAVEKHLEKLQSFAYGPKHDAASAFRDAVITQDFKEAHNRLDHLRSLIEEGKNEFAKIGEFENSVRHLVSIITNNEVALERILKHFDRTIKSVSKDLNLEKSEEDKIRKKVLNDYKKITNLSKLIFEKFKEFGNLDKLEISRFNNLIDILDETNMHISEVKLDLKQLLNFVIHSQDKVTELIKLIILENNFKNNDHLKNYDPFEINNYYDDLSKYVKKELKKLD